MSQWGRANDHYRENTGRAPGAARRPQKLGRNRDFDGQRDHNDHSRGVGEHDRDDRSYVDERLNRRIALTAGARPLSNRAKPVQTGT